MATVIKPKRSETGSSVPTTSNLAVGEMAVNTADQKIYVRDSADNIVVVADSAAAGAGISDVVEDTTPQLGGDLDLNSSDITGTGNLNFTGSITLSGTVDGRDVATDGTKLDGIEASADVTDTTNVTAAGALMDSEVTNLAQVKAFSSADYATAAQGTTADSALQDVVDDTTPQLGGDLDGQGNNIYTLQGNIGSDAGDYLTFTTDTRMDVFVNGNNEFRFESDGDFHADGDVIAYSTTTSDVRLKSDVEPITDALSKVNQLSGYTFTRNHNGQKSAGILAHELEKVLPEAVREKELPLQQDDGEKYKVVEYDAIHGLLIEAVKELSDKVERLEARLQIEDGLGNK